MRSSSWNIWAFRSPHGCRQDYQREFGGHPDEYAKGDMAYRACAAADRTGHAILHTLSQQCLRHKARFFIEYFALDLLMDEDGACRGLLAGPRGRIDPPVPGQHDRHRDRRCGRVTICTSAHTCTGDGSAVAARRAAAQDMEFIQFHPTGVYGAGVLITEGARGEGGDLPTARASASCRNTRRARRILSRACSRAEAIGSAKPWGRREKGSHPPASRAPARESSR